MKLRKSLAITLSLSMAFGLMAGCAQDGGQASKAPDPAPVASGAPAPTDQGGNSAEPIVIGTIQDLSGGASEAGNANAWGVEYAARVINENGGINGRPLEVIKMDCKNDVQEGINCYRLLVDEKNVAAIVGPPLSNPALAWVDLSEEDEMPIVGHFMDERCTTNEETGEPYPYMFLAEPGCAQQSYCIAAYAVEELGLKTFATFYNAGLSYAVMHAEPFVEYVTAQGGTVLAEESFQSGDVDYRAQAVKIANANPEAVFVCNYAADNALCYDYLREAGYEGIILGNNTFQAPFNSLVKSEITDTYFLMNVDMDNPEDPSYAIVQKYLEETGTQYPIANACFGYDATMVLAEGLKAVEDPYDGPAVAAALNNVKDAPGAAYPITINPATHRTLGMPMLISQYDEDFHIKVIASYTLSEEWES